MTMARGDLVDASVTPYYHCISRCVRRAHLCGAGYEHRKQWIEDRLRKLSGIFAIDVCGYAILDNHLPVVLRLNDRASADWSDEEVDRRWGELFPPRGNDRQPLPLPATKAWVATARERLNSLGWFMKCVKEPLAPLANKEDECRGTLWEGRFKSIAILDEEALLRTLAYVDLNPLASGIGHTSVKARFDHCREQSKLAAVVADAGNGRSTRDVAVEDESLWLPPIEDRREDRGVAAGLCATMNLSGYLQLLDWSSRLFASRQGACPAGGRRSAQSPGHKRGCLGESPAKAGWRGTHNRHGTWD